METARMICFVVLWFIVYGTALFGCAQPYQQQSQDPVAAQCEYEATAQTSGAGNPLVLGFRRQELFVMCMRGKGR